MSYSSKGVTSKELTLTLLLLEQSSMGRYQLSREINQTKARARSIIDLLTNKQLAISNRGRGGTKLSERGMQVVSQLHHYLYIDRDQKSTSFEEKLIFPKKTYEYTVVLFNQPGVETNGLYERDSAVREGAQGAVTLLRDQLGWYFPDDNPNDEQQRAEHFSTKHDNYNLAILSFGVENGTANMGAIAGAYYHLEEEIRSITDPFLTTTL